MLWDAAKRYSSRKRMQRKIEYKEEKGRKRGLRLGSTDAEALVNYNCDTRGKNVINSV
jgi:hypothetical protein